MNRFLKTLLRTGVYFLDQAEDATSAVRHRVRDRVDGITDRAAQVIRGEESHTARDVVSFVAGVGLGIGVGLLFAPASGEQTREAITAKVQDFGDSMRERFSSQARRPGTGTDGS